MMDDFPISFRRPMIGKMIVMFPAELLLLSFRCDAPFIVPFFTRQ
jgi:hypothetical protein